MSLLESRKTERGRDGPALALLAGAYTDILLESEDLGTSLQDVQARKLKCSFLVMEYSALLNNAFEALNLRLIILLYFCSRN